MTGLPSSAAMKYQRCRACGHVGPVSTTREYDDGCPACGSEHSIVRSHDALLTRICCACGAERPMDLRQVCGRPQRSPHGIAFANGCGSDLTAPTPIQST